MATAVEEVTIKTSDGKILKMPKKHAEMSSILKDLMGDIDDLNDTPIPLFNVTEVVMEKVKLFCAEFIDKPIPESFIEQFREEFAFGKNGLTEWMQEFVAVPVETLFAMLTAANYLDLKQMVDITAKRCADIITELTEKDDKAALIKMFDLPEIITPEEEVALCRRYPWLNGTAEDGAAGGDSAS